MDIDLNQQVSDIFENKDYVRIMNKAARPFSKILSEEDLKSHQMIAAWKALLKYNPSKGASFMTFLYRGVFLECKMAAKKEMRQRSVVSKRGVTIRIFNVMGETFDMIAHKDRNLEMVDLLEELKTIEDGDLVVDYYLNKRSLDEMGVSKGVKKSHVYYKKNKAVKILRDRLSETGV